MKKINVLCLSFLVLIMVILSSPVVIADDDDDDDEAWDDKGSDLGSVAIGLMVIGSLYVILRRTYMYSRRFLSKEEHPLLLANIKQVHSKLRSPLLNIHYIVMVLATIVAVIHGLLLGLDDGKGISGWIAAGLMIVLSISGIFIWRRFKPIWEYRGHRTHLRFIHQQWLFSAIMIIALIIHVE